jgi:hypothetical protein
VGEVSDTVDRGRDSQEVGMLKGDIVELADAVVATRGVVTAILEDGQRATVKWQVRPGLEGQETTERVAALRKVHAPT